MNYWLFKTEPNVFSIEDLKNSPNKTCFWEGVRNYQARNLLRDDIKKGDSVLFYHSRVEPIGIVGLAVVTKAGYPDKFAFEPSHKYFDPKSKPENPTWYGVDVKYVRHFPRVLTLTELKANKELSKMVLTQKGSRLSIQPVTESEYNTILDLSK
ncbi:EVE domain-containing protein [Leptospira sp. GIMC2001]|uniref:EVE domain-containing protein n=1 Tax=Leptospira sp. GIMC2001 TaxID=1513297 RepID=UPI00234B8641|nr:EVE domain-containing protein [Leptospira sp. GIMC2001]WCL49958.1 EVE domain-containing protein [Leptospira sp. GIMC2001]